MVLKRHILWMSFLVLACQRVPEWEVRRDSPDQQKLLQQLSRIQEWMWTCRGVLSKEWNPALHPPAGLLMSRFIDEFKRGGLTVVDVSSSQTVLGTALLWSREGLLLFLNHWMEYASDVECRGPQGEWLKAELIGSDADLNLALLRVDADDLPKKFKRGVVGLSDWAKAHKVDLEDRLYVLASSHVGMIDRLPVASQLLRTNLQTGIDESLIVFSPAPPPHFAGGLLMNDSGEALGYLFPRSSGSWGAALAMGRVSDLVNELRATGSIKRVYLGMVVRWAPDNGFVVQEIEVGGAAYAAGIRLGDILVEWNGQRITDSTDWPSLTAKDLGSLIDVRLLRNSREIELQIETKRALRP